MVDLINTPKFKSPSREYLTALADTYETRPLAHMHFVHDMMFRHSNGKIYEINIAVREANPLDVAASFGMVPVAWEDANG